MQWPVYRVRRIPDLERDAAGALQISVGEIPPGAVNPYEKLRELNGLPLQAFLGGSSAQGVTVRDDILAIKYDDGTVVRTQIPDILRQLGSSLSRLAGVVGNYERFAPVTTHDLLENRVYSPESCRFVEPFSYDDRSGMAPIRLVRVIYENDGEVASILVHVGK